MSAALAVRVDGGHRFQLRRREPTRVVAGKESRVPPVQLLFSLSGGPLLEIRIPCCPLFEPLGAIELRSVPVEIESPFMCGAVTRHAMGHILVTKRSAVAAPGAEPTLDLVVLEARVAVPQVVGAQPVHHLRPDEAATPALKVRALNAPGR